LVQVVGRVGAFPPPSRRTLRAVLPHTAHRRLSPAAFGVRQYHGPVGTVIPYVMTMAGAASIPGTKTPGEYKPQPLAGK